MDEKCVLCKADFVGRPDALVTSVGGVKKCKSCEAKWPKALTNEEIQVKNQNKAKTLDEARVQEIVYEVIEEYGLVRHKCEKCLALFPRRKPMQTLCKKCDAKVETKKEVK